MELLICHGWFFFSIAGWSILKSQGDGGDYMRGSFICLFISFNQWNLGKKWGKRWRDLLVLTKNTTVLTVRFISKDKCHEKGLQKKYFREQQQSKSNQRRIPLALSQCRWSVLFINSLQFTFSFSWQQILKFTVFLLSLNWCKVLVLVADGPTAPPAGQDETQWNEITFYTLFIEKRLWMHLSDVVQAYKKNFNSMGIHAARMPLPPPV